MGPSRYTALVVDDDPDVRASVSEIVSDLGHRSTEASDGQEALEILRRSQPLPDVILLDLAMPNLNGWRFLEERKKEPRLATIPVAILSAVLEAAELPEVAGYLRKPVSLEMLRTLFEHLREGRVYRQPPRAEPGPVLDALRVLLIEPNAREAEVTELNLRNTREFRFEVTRAEGLEDGLSRDKLAAADVVLLDLDLPGETGLSALAKTLRRAPDLPVIVLVTARSRHLRDGAISKGAEESLEKELQSPELLGRAVHYAWERRRLRAELERARELAAHERELRGLALWARSRSTVASEMLGQTALKKHAPETFQQFVARFVAITERAVAAHGFSLDAVGQRGELQALADEMAALRVGPSDIVDVYQQVLTSAWQGDETELTAARREEARLMLIGLLGYVLATYRLHLMPAHPRDAQH